MTDQAAKAPGQNLDRRFHSAQVDMKSPKLLSWKTSLNNSTAPLDFGSYGPPYTLTLEISSPFTLSGPDTSLSLSKSSNESSGSIETITFTTADGFEYPLRSVSPSDGFDLGHPGRIWTNQSSSSHEPVPITLPTTLRIETDVVNGSRVWANDTFVGRFEVFVFGGRNTLFSWSQMALVAPLDSIEGGVTSLLLQAGTRLGAL
jgi:hexosaminidase